MPSPSQILHGELERNHACVQAGIGEDRRKNIEEMRHTAHRMGELALLSLAKKYPKATIALLDRDIDHASGYEYIGAGSQHTVIGNDRSVIKIHRMSSFMAEGERVEYYENALFGMNALKHYLGDLVAPQSITIGPNPLEKKTRAVLTVQKRLDFIPTRIFPAYEHSIRAEELDTLITNDGKRDDISRLTRSGLAMANNIGMVPDTSGLHNIVLIKDPSLSFLGDECPTILSCMDGLPVSVEDDPRGVERIVNQLEDLKQRLAA